MQKIQKGIGEIPWFSEGGITGFSIMAAGNPKF